MNSLVHNILSYLMFNLHTYSLLNRNAFVFTNINGSRVSTSNAKDKGAKLGKIHGYD